MPEQKVASEYSQVIKVEWDASMVVKLTAVCKQDWHFLAFFKQLI